jgi:hypothetical protein
MGGHPVSIGAFAFWRGGHRVMELQCIGEMCPRLTCGPGTCVCRPCDCLDCQNRRQIAAGVIPGFRHPKSKVKEPASEPDQEGRLF